MNAIELLLDRRWILKSENKELYYKIRDSVDDIKKFVSEKLGCQLIVNSTLVKIEKIPVIPEKFMGIQDFVSKQEYAYLCIILMFLEDKDNQEQFILSQLTEYISANMPDGSADWTLFNNRKALIRVLRYVVKQGILKITDGSDDMFMDNESGEVLYENTGASKFFIRNFTRDIMQYSSADDFRQSDWFESDDDKKGMARRHRVYKRLLFAPGMYDSDSSAEDFDYLKYYGRRLSEEIEMNLEGYVHIHKGSAFFLAGRESNMGNMFPGNNSQSDVMLLCFNEIRQRIENGEWSISKDEVCEIDIENFETMLADVKRKYGAGFIKAYREMSEKDFIISVMDVMELWMFIRVDKSAEYVKIYPSVGIMTGHYPDDYSGRNIL